MLINRYTTSFVLFYVLWRNLYTIMKTLNTILLAFLCLIYSCTQPVQKTSAAKPAADTAKVLAKVVIKKSPEKVIRAKRAKTSLNDLYAKSKRTCPVLVKKCNIVVGGNGSRAIIVTLQNNTAKKIGAVKVSWIVYNRSGQQIGNSSGMAKKEVARGRSASYSWDIYAHNGTLAKAFVYNIHYKDGSMWKVE